MICFKSVLRLKSSLMLACLFIVKCDTVDPICEQLRGLPPNASESQEEFPILTIGLTSKSLLVVTKEHFVYELDPSDMDTAKHRLTLRNMPKTFAKKWPSLVRHTKDILSTLSFTVFHQGSDYLFVMTNSKQPNLAISLDQPLMYSNLAISLDQPLMYSNLSYQANSNSSNVTWVSANQDDHFYRMQMNNSTVQMVSVQLQTITQMKNAGSVKSICLLNNGEIMSTLNDCPLPNSSPIQWSIKRGFSAGQFFYLLSSDRKVYIFPQSTYESDTRSNLTTLTFGQFFQCHSHQPNNPIGKRLDFAILGHNNKETNYFFLTNIILFSAIITLTVFSFVVIELMVLDNVPDQYGPLKIKAPKSQARIDKIPNYRSVKLKDNNMDNKMKNSLIKQHKMILPKMESNQSDSATQSSMQLKRMVTKKIGAKGMNAKRMSSKKMCIKRIIDNKRSLTKASAPRQNGTRDRKPSFKTRACTLNTQHRRKRSLK